MLRSAIIAGLFLLTPILVEAQVQKTPPIEVFSGVSYMNVAGYYEREHFGNLATGVTVNVNKYFGIAADVGLPLAGPSETFLSLIPGSRFNPPFVSSGRQATKTIPALFGPRFFLRREKVTLFTHALAGVVRTRTTSEYRLVSVGSVLGILPTEPSSFTYSTNHFAYGFGGGIDININRRFSIRVLQADYLRARIQADGNQLRLQSGLVVRFGKGSN